MRAREVKEAARLDSNPMKAEEWTPCRFPITAEFTQPRWQGRPHSAIPCLCVIVNFFMYRCTLTYLMLSQPIYDRVPQPQTTVYKCYPSDALSTMPIIGIDR